MPLAAYQLFRTRALDEAREQVGRVFSPHRLELLRGEELNAVQNVARLQHVCLSFLSYGGAVRVRVRGLESFYLVQMLQAGRAKVTAGGQSVISTPSLASVLSPDDSVEMAWSPHSRQLDVYLERGALERQLEALIDTPLRRPLRFSLGMELWKAQSRDWLRLVSILQDEFERGGVLLRQPLAAAQLEELLMTTLLLAQPSNYSALLNSEPALSAPRSLRQVLDYLEAHVQEPLTVGELARVANVSVRSLQQSFRRHLDTTPTAQIRAMRLQRAHEDLLAADPQAGRSVAEIALRWGFTHLGRFSLLYRKEFGVAPSRTLWS